MKNIIYFILGVVSTVVFFSLKTAPATEIYRLEKVDTANEWYKIIDDMGEVQISLVNSPQGFNTCNIYNTSGLVAQVRYMRDGDASIMDSVIYVVSSEKGKEVYEIENPDFHEADINK